MMRTLSIALCLALLVGCGHGYRKDQEKNPGQFTLGQAQLRIKKGMTQTEVAQAMGSPNIVTKDSDGREAWVYDKMSSSVQYYNSSGGFWLVIVGGGGDKGAATTSQNTLTIVVKYDDEGRVCNVTYHSSRY